MILRFQKFSFLVVVIYDHVSTHCGITLIYIISVLSKVILNDSSAAVMARNVLFIYLCTQMPDDPEAVKKWIASFPPIWFCHEFLPEFDGYLMCAYFRCLGCLRLMYP